MGSRGTQMEWTHGWRAPRRDTWREPGRDYFPETGLHSTSSPDELFLWRESREYRALFLARTEEEDPRRREGGAIRQFLYKVLHPASFAGLATASLGAVGILTVATLILQFIRREHFDSGSIFSTVTWVLTIVFIGLSIALLIYIGGSYAAARRAFIERVRLQKATAVNIALHEASSKLEANQLFKLNRRQLDEYHILSVRQQNIAFKAAQVASAIAFVLLTAAVVIAIWPVGGEDSGFPVSKAVAAGLSGLGSALSSFIAATFYSNFRATTKQLKEYYWEPFNTSRLLGLERLVERAGTSRAAAPELYKEMLTYLYTQPLFAHHAGDKPVPASGNGTNKPKPPSSSDGPPS